MERPREKVRALDYLNPLREQRRSPAFLWLLAAVSLSVVMIAGYSVLDEFRHRKFTPEYLQYTFPTKRLKPFDPADVPPPFTGRKYVYQSPFEVTAFYACVVFGAIGGFAIRSALRRQRWL